MFQNAVSILYFAVLENSFSLLVTAIKEIIFSKKKHIKQKPQTTYIFGAFYLSKRKVRDSNPRTREGQRLSRPSQSTTLPTFRLQNYNFLAKRKALLGLFLFFIAQLQSLYCSSTSRTTRFVSASFISSYQCSLSK